MLRLSRSPAGCYTISVRSRERGEERIHRFGRHVALSKPSCQRDRRAQLLEVDRAAAALREVVLEALVVGRLERP